MFSARTITLTVLILLPLAAYLALGGYALWKTGLFMQTFWILPGFWLLTWIIAASWKPASRAIEAPPPVPGYFTPQDEAAMGIVRRYQLQVDELTPAQLCDIPFYWEQSKRLSRDLAEHYHPGADDPVSSLTVPEVLAAMRLAIDDMERWMLESVPGGRLVTIRQWKWLEHAPQWTRRIQNAVWVAGVLLNPANLLRYATSQVTVGPIADELQAEFLAAVYLRYIREIGFYLIEMNSGRLRGGADHYRRVFGSLRQAESTAVAQAVRKSGATGLHVESVTVTLVGQVKAGKSSLVNALLNERVASTDVLPETTRVNRYRMRIPDSDGQLTLLDTPGYADFGATKQEMAELRRALRETDVVLLVLDAHSPARSTDREVVDELQKWYDTHKELRPPPVVICLTHVDLLSPVMEWNPPYDWRVPGNSKSQSIHDAVEHVRELFSDVVRDVIPVCSDADRGRARGVVEELLPALLEVLSEGQSAAILRAYYQQLDRERFQLVLRQIRNSGKELLKLWIDERLLSGNDQHSESSR